MRHTHQSVNLAPNKYPHGAVGWEGGTKIWSEMVEPYVAIRELSSWDKPKSSHANTLVAFSMDVLHLTIPDLQ